MKVRYTAGALRDLASIAAYLRPLNPPALARVRSDIRAAIRQVGQHPFGGRAQDIINVRKVVTRRYGYLIFYAVDEVAMAVDILVIQHGAQDRNHKDG